MGVALFKEPEPCETLVCIRLAPDTKGDAFLLGALIGGALGGGFGALAGSSWRSDVWEQVPLDRLSASFVPQRDGRLGLAASISF
jgi:hypothetical protein